MKRPRLRRCRPVLAVVLISLIALLTSSLMGQTEVLKSLAMENNLLPWNELFGQSEPSQASAISIVWEMAKDSNDLGSMISQLAFGKMLQIEAMERHGIKTELVLATAPSLLLRDCFPGFVSEARVLRNHDELYDRKAEQARKLGAKSVLLEPTADVWEDGLELLSQLVKISSFQTNGEISSPFIQINTHQSYPALHQWHRLAQLVEFARLDEEKCCTLPNPSNSDSILLLEDDTRIQSIHIPSFFNRTRNWEWVTIVHDDSTPALYAPLREAGFAPHAIHDQIPGAFSSVARYCLAQHARGELVGLWEDAPLTFWAALSNHYNTMGSNKTKTKVRLLGKKLPPRISYDRDDPREMMSFEVMPSLTEIPPQKPAQEQREIVRSVSTDTGRSSAEAPAAKSGLLGTPSTPVTIVIHVSGEMGNMISKISYGYGLKWMLEEDHNIHSEILLQHQKLSKWRQASMNVQRCFPAAREWSFEAANTVEYEDRERQQKTWMRENYDYFHFKNPCEREDCIQDQLSFMVKQLHNTSGRPSIEDNYNISMPYICSDEYASISYFNDRYAARILNMWKFDIDNPECCAERVDPDEVAFHIRGFLGEMPRRGRRLGYEELSPAKVANELLGSLKAGDKVALAGRLAPDLMINYTLALEARDLIVRFIDGQSPTQDFCFLMSAKKDFTGFAMSTYAVWAAYLGNATKPRLYSVKSPDRITRLGEDEYFFRYHWTAPEMKRVVFEEYNSEEQDKVEMTSKRT